MEKVTRVLLCERSFDGHRQKYFAELTQCAGVEIYGFAPKNVGIAGDKFIIFHMRKDLPRLIEYIMWIRQLRQLVQRFNIDVIHILDGDSIRRYCGIGLSFSKCKVIMTLHHFFSGFFSYMSYKFMSKKCHFVVHTETIADVVKKNISSKVTQINYPAFDIEIFSHLKSDECKEYYQLKKTIPTIGIVGGLNRYKNILPFLSALNGVKEDFQLLICGKDNDILPEEIYRSIKEYSVKVKLIIKKLTEEEYRMAICASDIIYSLYGKDFDGASGPLTDGVCGRKYILSCNHGSLGDIVRKFHLGITANCDDEKSMIMATKKALEGISTFQFDEMSTRYYNSLYPEFFKKEYAKLYRQGQVR